MLRHLPATGYDNQPWKNGQGWTEEVLLLPDGADRDAFDLRISRAAIVDDAPFSAFPGVDRIITVIEGDGLVLEFGDETVTLDRLAPFRFDSGRAPVGRPRGTAVRVLNVMAARGVWRLDPAWVQDAARATTTASPTVVYALAPSLVVGGLSLAAGDTALTGVDTPVTGAAVLIPLARGRTRADRSGV